MAVVLNGIMWELFVCAFKEKYKFSDENSLENIALCVATVWDDNENIRDFFEGNTDSLSLPNLAYLHRHLKLTDKKIDRLIKKYNLIPNDNKECEDL